jgi:uncharacterized protein
MSDDDSQPSGATPDTPLPVAAEERVASLDFIRGIAVLGILAANIVAFGQPFTAYMYPDAFTVPHGETSDRLWAAQFVLIDGKMRGLFTLLFGAGMALFMDKAWARGATRWLQVRRLFWLLVFGLIHFYLIWQGDILTYYAATGFVATLFLRASARSLLVAGLLGYLAGAVVYLGLMSLPYFVAETSLGEQPQFAEMRVGMAQQVEEDLADGREETAIIRDGSYGDYVSHIVAEHGADPFTMLLLFAFETLPLMLIGMALYRMGLFSGGLDPGKVRRWGWIALIVGTALTIPIAAWALARDLGYWATLAAFMGFSPLPRLLMVLGLTALLALWGAGARGWLARRLSAAGRMAFSNYLGTSVLMMAVFHGWGLGLFGELGRPALYGVTLGAWIVMLAWSQPWLARFYYGPLEWLWRCLTYGRLFPLRR